MQVIKVHFVYGIEIVGDGIFLKGLDVKPRLSALCHLCPLLSRPCHSDFCFLDMI